MACLVPSAHAASPEVIFKRAEKYTVELKTSIDRPFVWDSKQSSQATGFVVDKARGWILTNAHVAGRSPSRIVASFKGAEPFKAETVYVDPLLDIAVLKAPLSNIPKDATQAELDCKQVAQPGHPVGAYGHPYGLTYTATRGIISGTNIVDGNERLQTDAPINSGNSGGPLISIDSGQVVGINTAKVKKEGVEGLSFAIASPYACRIVELLRAGKDPSPAIMPVMFFETDEPVPPTVARVLNGHAESGIREGDVVVGVNGDKTRIESINQLQHEMRGRSGKVTWRVQRDGKLVDVKLDVHRMPRVETEVGIYISGLMLARNTVRDDRPTEEQEHLMVHYIHPGTAAELLQLEPFDYLVTVDGKRFTSNRDMYGYLKSLKAGSTIRLKIKRGSQNYRRHYDYHEMYLPVERLEWVHF